VRCELRLADDLAPVLADRGQLEQVLMNLAVNARDAMPLGGTVTITTRNVTLDARDVAGLNSVDEVMPGDYVCIDVTDTGTGMTTLTQARVFEPFFTTKPAGSGTGLGLSTVYGIVRQSGGYVAVCSEPGSGTRFSVYLPKAEGTAAAVPQPRRPAQPHEGAETVLVVDDDESVLSAATRMLSKAGYTVLRASSPVEAEALAAAHAGEIHLLVTDVMTPQMNGGELARRICMARPATRVLYMSGYTNDTVIGRGVITPDTVFLAKPFTMADATAKVREALAR
jgi:two-component system, cell cycle sensor histidine kinase and response regulator CckA